MSEQRLQKVMAAAGVDSRRKCEELILAGVVRVNHKVIDTLPAFVDPEKDIITVNGKKIRGGRKVYFLLNKPKGVICTNFDPQGRKKAVDFIDTNQRILCAGRLDVDASGLVIITSDSEMANRLARSQCELPKTYITQVKGMIDGTAVEKLKKGIWLAEGKTARASIKILKRSHNESAIEITVSQEFNRQIYRMLAKVGLKVKSLKRTRIGKIDDRGIGMGKCRPLTQIEINYLDKIATD
jgi:23S rRNA pseudouridine2605 synthase